VSKDTKIRVTSEGRKHLGAKIGSESFKLQYLQTKVEQWSKELQNLIEIAKSDPQAAYSCFVTGFKQKLNYVMRTIPDSSNSLRKIDEIVANEFIPTINGGRLVNEVERMLLSLPVKCGGLGIPIFSEIAEAEFRR